MATRTEDLTEFAKPIANDLYQRIGKLNLVLSAGVVALSKLSAEDREKIIIEAISGEVIIVELTSNRRKSK